MNSAERHEARYQRRKAAREKKRREKLDKYDNMEHVASIPALLHANWDSKKGVMFKASVARYNRNAFINAAKQSKALLAGKDVRQGFHHFTIIERGKERKIHSLHYGERVIRRSVCINALVPILSSNLIYDNGASLKGKGVGFSADRCEAHLHRYFREHGSNEGYVITIDFKSYFDNIPHEPLKAYIDRYVLDPQLNRLTDQFIEAPDLDRPPEEHGKGLYIGPEDSQIYAVAYPNDIDHLIKDKWRQKYFDRYNDDSVLIVPDKETAHRLYDALMVEYERKGIIPNRKKTQIVKLSRGFTFLKTKYFLTDTGKVVRKTDHAGIVRERRKLKKQYRFYIKGEMTLDQITQSFMSWRGSALKRNAYRSVHCMDTLYYGFFKAKPWKKTKKRSK